MITKVGKSIYKLLPNNWKEVKWKDYQKLIQIQVADEDLLTGKIFMGLENVLKIISKFTDIEVNQLENLPMSDLNELALKIKFMEQPPMVDYNSKLKFKNYEELTYNDYVVFQQFGNDLFSNSHLILPSYLKTKITTEEIENLDMEQMYSCFFLQKKKWEKLQKRILFYLKVKAMDKKIKGKMKKILKNLLSAMSLKKH